MLVMRQLEQSYPWSNSGLTATVTSLYQYRYGSTQTILLALFGAVGCVLLIGCVNVANLLLAQGSSRKKELAVRASLGADRWRLMRQLVTESVTLSLMGGCLGILLAVAGLHIIARVLPHDLPQLTEIKIDWTALLFTLAVSLITGLLFGTAPAMHAASGNLNPALTETGRGSSTSRTAKRLRSILLIAEIAIALVLVTTSGLMIRSMMKAVKVDPGFQADHLLALDVVLSPTKYGREEEKSVFFTQAVQRLRALPGVHAASAAIFLPLTGHNDTTFMLADHAVESVVDLATAASNVVVPGYFETLRVPLLRGRFFFRCRYSEFAFGRDRESKSCPSTLAGRERDWQIAARRRTKRKSTVSRNCWCCRGHEAKRNGCTDAPRSLFTGNTVPVCSMDVIASDDIRCQSARRSALDF